MSFSDQQLLDLFREKLASRGCRGMIGLQRRFKIVDDDGSKDLDLQEFKKAIKEMRVPVADNDMSRVFAIFDRDRSGSVDYDEFLRAVRGEMNNFRKGFCKQAFDIMDKDKSGQLNMADIRGFYNAAKHPDVLSGKKTEDDILTEFLDTFEMHYSLNHPGERDGAITIEEWYEYYSNVSMSIDDDAYFELMIRNAWHISGGTGASANTTCRRVLQVNADGSEQVVEIKNDIGKKPTGKNYGRVDY
jgi:hypothetical protein